MDFEIAGIDINDFEKKVLEDDNLSPEFKLSSMVLIKRYKLLINCDINQYKYLSNCMGGTTKLIDNINNQKAEKSLVCIEDIDINN
tara:strand:- start:491 stop:748 length:258 start_codon:yes stop_codon:yes gene_type:complete